MNELTLFLGVSGIAATVKARLYLAGVQVGADLAMAEIGATGVYAGPPTPLVVPAGAYQALFFIGADPLARGVASVFWDGAAEIDPGAGPAGKELNFLLGVSGITTLKARRYLYGVLAGADIPMAEVGATGLYIGDMAGAAGIYDVLFFVDAEPMPRGIGRMVWDGSVEVTLSAVGVTTAVEPVTLLEAKLHVKLITDPEDASTHPDDAKLSALISAAREVCEQFCGRAFVQGAHTSTGEHFCTALLAPVSSIISVTYIDTDGVAQALPSTVYELNGDADAPALRLKIGQSWPGLYALDDAVRVTYNAGVVPAAVPRPVWAAMLLIIGTLYDNRASELDRQTFTLPMRVQDLLMPYRIGMGV